jgi:hypothetical protein
MKKEFINYAEEIGLTAPFIEKVKDIFNFYSSTGLGEIVDIFITDYIAEDGTRRYESVWFFSEKYIMEAKNFLFEDDFDIAPFKRRVKYWNVKMLDYDFIKATEKSRLTLFISMDTGLVCKLKASKENCDYLNKIMRKYALGYLKE